MAFFQIASTVVEIQSKGGASLTYERIGPTFRAYDGTFRSQVRAQKRIWQGDTPPLTNTEADAVTGLVGTGLNTVGGDWPGATINVYLEILNDVPIKDPREASDVRRILTIKATEI